MAAETLVHANDEESPEEELVALLHRVLGSCNISFLFGAGVNGRAFPFFAQFRDTIDRMHELGLSEDGIEEALQGCDDDAIRQKVFDTFINEFNSKTYSLENQSIVNLRRLLSATHRAVSRAENRHHESKRVNVFTLNYDRIVEEVLETSGYFNYVLKRDTKSFLPFNVVGYDTQTRSFLPTFAVYKLHGSVGADRQLASDGIVFPGQDKLGSIISEFYETLFAMKSELLRKNATLFVIGYSWADEHVNSVINSAIDSGLTVVFPQYSADTIIPEWLAERAIVIPPGELGEDGKPCDTTKTLAAIFEKAMNL
ncbi:SIR2 family protein [Actinomyces sp.]|uniref:SIR2 family protein n=1 Tax=Actinomyces sp. TaxID=29317 RepID=UPI0026DCF635|nr:SIR2 family protein [Actinomyces sp.]MDO4899180.1 SIR2 family protein [Actinomyces sp.]